MKVTLEEFGGFAAGIRRPQHVVDAGTMAAGDAEELARRASAAASAPAPVAGGTVRDGMSYVVTIDDGGKQTVLEQSDGAMSTEFAALLDFLAGRGGSPAAT